MQYILLRVTVISPAEGIIKLLVKMKEIFMHQIHATHSVSATDALQYK